MNRLAERLDSVRLRMEKACREAGRDPSQVRLLAVSKQHPVSAIRDLFALGQRAFGENRVQEALNKLPALDDLAIEWHFIGPIQSNKAKDIARHFDWVQSADREKVLRKLNAFRPAELPPIQLCLQVNIDEEPQKAGARPSDVAALADLVASLERLQLRGLMCIPTAGAQPEQTAESYRRMRALSAELAQGGHALDTLSMGMSGDLSLAVAGGSTMVRIGTDLFGPRPVRGAQPKPRERS